MDPIITATIECLNTFAMSISHYGYTFTVTNKCLTCNVYIFGGDSKVATLICILCVPTSLSSHTKYIMDDFLFTLNISLNINMMPWAHREWLPILFSRLQVYRSSQFCHLNNFKIRSRDQIFSYALNTLYILLWWYYHFYDEETWNFLKSSDSPNGYYNIIWNSCSYREYYAS